MSSKLPLSACRTPLRPGTVYSVTDLTGEGMPGMCSTRRPKSRLSRPSNLNQPIGCLLSPDLPGDPLDDQVGQVVHVLHAASVDDDVADGDGQAAAGALRGRCAHGRR